MKNGSPKTDPSNFSLGSPNDKEKDDKDLNSQSRHDIPIYYSNYIHSSIISICQLFFSKPFLVSLNCLSREQYYRKTLHLEIYHLVMTNSSPWKIPKTNGGINAGKIIYFYGPSIPWLCLS